MFLHYLYLQGGPLEHVIAAKAVAFGEALDLLFKEYQTQVKKNAAVLAQAFMDKGYKVISGGTDNHSMPGGTERSTLTRSSPICVPLNKAR